MANNSLKLTRRAGLSGLLVLAAGVAYSVGEFARFRRAVGPQGCFAKLEAVMRRSPPQCS